MKSLIEEKSYYEAKFNNLEAENDRLLFNTLEEKRIAIENMDVFILFDFFLFLKKVVLEL
jgi:hypothetical protein